MLVGMVLGTGDTMVSEINTWSLTLCHEYGILWYSILGPYVKWPSVLVIHFEVIEFQHDFLGSKVVKCTAKEPLSYVGIYVHTQLKLTFTDKGKVVSSHIEL